MSKILFNKIFAPMIGLPVDEKSMADGEKFLTANLPSVDAALAGRGFIVGDALSLADIALIAAMEPFEMIGYDMSKFENIVAWRNRLTGEAFYTHVHERYGAEMAG
ncbi:MAG: glutathione S-transferase C-terminal domain-containing protein, partial [Parvularculaceae bacterium]|nr:glutathione S-transferase C-terminal domain-containing protein [Parvularculaceae bacterium]